MHSHDLRPFAHSHRFEAAGTAQRERALLRVTVLTLATMLLELGAGWWSNSLALLADGWHMGTHALALGGAALAYRLARRVSARGGVGFGGWKIEVLAAYTSALTLLMVAIVLVFDGVQRLVSPPPVAYVEAISVAAVGLVVNIVSAWWLSAAQTPLPSHSHDHGHDHGHDGAHDHGAHAHHHDHNFAAAYAHVLADALTSLLAIAALAGGLWFGWRWLDAAAALFGAALIARWAISVARAAASSLIDSHGDPALGQRIRDAIERDGDAKLADLHVWQVGGAARAAALTIVADQPLSPLEYRARVADLPGLAHVTIEVNACPGDAHPA